MQLFDVICRYFLLKQKPNVIKRRDEKAKLKGILIDADK